MKTASPLETKMKRLLALVSLLLISACAPGMVGQGGPGPVRTGGEVLLDRIPEKLAGKRVGLITNHTGVDRFGVSMIDRLMAEPGLQLVALYSPEHGIRGEAAAGARIESGIDAKTGLPVHSLYGATQKPTPEMLQGVEALLFDIQDIGVRQYTYTSTMAVSMQAAAEKGIPFFVLDRPNPVTGTIIEGNILEPQHASFIGIYPAASRHGMTAGELAQYYNREQRINADLTVIPMQGWRRDMWYDETGLPWLNPSPNIRDLDAAIHYPGTVFFEATNLSEGRGTSMPFHQTGAPWLRSAEVVSAMEAMRLPGVRFEAVQIPVAAGTGKFPDQTIQGVRLVVTDRESYRPLRASLLLIDTIRRLHPGQFEYRGEMLRHAGSDRLVAAFRAGTIAALLDEWDRDSERFRQMRAPYLIYR